MTAATIWIVVAAVAAIVLGCLAWCAWSVIVVGVVLDPAHGDDE